MADPQQGATAASGLQIPPDIQQKFGPLIELIKGSQSMNNEERQYWINILGVMTAEQLKNLEDILVNEKKQLAAIDDKYNKELSAVGTEKSVQDIEGELKSKRAAREAREHSEAEDEQKREEALLQQIAQT